MQLGKRAVATTAPTTNATRAAVPFKASAQRRSVVSRAGKDNDGGRQPWDLGRFARTLWFFNGPNGSLTDILGGLFKPKPAPTTPEPGSTPSAVIPLPGSRQATPKMMANSADGIVLVAGATGGVGKRVVEQLLARGRRVRALVRDVPKATELLSGLSRAAGASLELAAADIVQRRTLVPEIFDGVTSVVCCTAVKVVPKEGDTVDRKKYYQGIKFYDPEIVGDTPESVEYNGMQNLLDALGERLGRRAGRPLLDAANAAGQWGALDDVVMGGVSQSRVTVVPGAGPSGEPAAVFGGYVSTDNNGGFASVRCRNFSPALDCSAYEGLEICLKGDGQRYKFTVRCDAAWDGVGFCKSFDTKAGEWHTVRLPFKDFAPVFRARTMPNGPRLNPASITSIQLMLSKFEYDGALNPSFKAGPFELPIVAIKAYMPEPVAPKFVHVSSAGVTRPNRPGINVDMEPPAVKLNDALGGILTFKLKGEDVVRASGIPYAIVRPCALTEEPRGAPLELDQGDVIKGKISRDEVADLCLALLESPEGLDKTFEIKSTVPFSQPWTAEAAAGAAPRDWRATLAAAGLQEGVTGKTVNGVYTGKQPEAAAAKAAALV